MKRTVILVLLLAGGFGCSSQPVPAPVAGQTATYEAKPRKEKPMPVPVLKKEALQSAIENNGVVLLIRGTTASVTQPGTRSESVDITAEVLELILGKADKTISLRRYTSKGDVVIVPGKLFVVAAIPNARYGTAFELLGEVATDETKRPAAVEAHRAAIKKLQPN
jgi:hypothetical protein